MTIEWALLYLAVGVWFALWGIAGVVAKRDVCAWLRRKTCRSYPVRRELRRVK